MNDENSKPVPANGCKVMTDKDIEEYIKAVNDGGVRFANETESTIAKNLKELAVQYVHGQQQLVQMKQQIAQMEPKLNKMSGSIDAFTTVLVHMEDARREPT